MSVFRQNKLHESLLRGNRHQGRRQRPPEGDLRLAEASVHRDTTKLKCWQARCQCPVGLRSAFALSVCTPPAVRVALGAHRAERCASCHRLGRPGGDADPLPVRLDAGGDSEMGWRRRRAGPGFHLPGQTARPGPPPAAVAQDGREGAATFHLQWPARVPKYSALRVHPA
jgi:hypothetical protein